MFDEHKKGRQSYQFIYHSLTYEKQLSRNRMLIHIASFHVIGLLGVTCKKVFYDNEDRGTNHVK
jgi:hypothetical protein